MTGQANERSRRFGYDKESVFETTAIGSFVNPSAQSNVVVNPDREFIERDEHLNTFADLYPADPGVQLFDASVDFQMCKETYADNKRLFAAAMGSEDANSAITSVAGTTTDSIVKVSAGTPQRILKVLGNDGKIYLVPVKTFTAGTDANLAMKLPPAAVGAGLVASNPATATGGVFSYLLGTSADTFMLEFDRSGQSGQIKYRAWGAPVRKAMFQFDLRKRIGWQFGFGASRWEKNPVSPAYQLADPNVRNNPFIGFACNAHLYQYTSAIAVSNRTVLKKIAFSFAPTLIDETGTKGLDGSSNIPGSDITGYTRAQNWQDKLALTLTYPDNAWHDRLDPSDTATYYGFFAEFFPNKPSSAPGTPRCAVWFPYIHLCAEPKLTVINAGECQDLLFNIGRDPAGTLAAAYIAMTNS